MSPRHPRRARAALSTAFLAALCAVPAAATEYHHYTGVDYSFWWDNLGAWNPRGVPGAADTAVLHAGISLGLAEGAEGGDHEVGTLNLLAPPSWLPDYALQLRGGTLTIHDGGVWEFGGFADFYHPGVGVVNQEGTMVLVDEQADDNGNGTLDTLDHAIDWGMTWNNTGTMRQEALRFSMGGATHYDNHGLHELTGDGSIVTGGGGGERTTNYGTLRKSGGTGESHIDSEFLNPGRVEALSGRLTVGNPLDYDGPGRTLTGGTWEVADGAELVLNAAPLEVNQGHIHLDGTGARLYTNEAVNPMVPLEEALRTNEGTLELNGNHSFTHPITNTGTLLGGATLQTDLTNAGTVAPGSSPGLLTVDGDYTQEADGTLLMEIADFDPFTGYDQLRVTGTATLGGTLEVTLLPPLDHTTLPDGARFDLVVAETLLGEFATVHLPAVAGGAFDLFVETDPSGPDTLGIRFTAVPEPVSLLLVGSAAGMILARRRTLACA